ncbi:MAG: hypothetical protein ACFBZ8_05560 [Opitutales bacterium]
MSGFDYDPFSDGDWDDRGELSWNEFDWQRYLKAHNDETGRYLGHYHRLKARPDHLDEVAVLMGWDGEDWCPSDADGAEDDTSGDSDGSESEDTSDLDDTDPYTIHKHPVFIATQALYQHLHAIWEHYVTAHQKLVSPLLAWKLCQSLHRGEMHAVLAINSLDLGDYSLTVCHLKNALCSLNQSLELIHEIPVGSSKANAFLVREAQVVLFDLREIWLRTMNECREETRRHPDND